MGMEHTPVQQRDIKFDVTGLTPAIWHPRGAHVSHFFNALSIFFPEGEKFFIESVRKHKEQVTDERLRADVKGFIGQEAMHGREHRAYNAWLAQHGYPVAKLEQRVIDTLKFAVKYTRRSDQLAATLALEHLTAIMADNLLSDPRVLEGADPRMSALWRWHAIEETEHKAVAFDVYQAAYGTGLRAYLRRVTVFLTTCIHFWVMVIAYHWAFVRKDGRRSDWRGWWQLLRTLWIEPGTMRRIFLPWLSYFRPSFHPWHQDNRVHVERWKAAFAAAGQAPP
jgi:predicted metal-dependent hydrolase